MLNVSTKSRELQDDDIYIGRLEWEDHDVLIFVPDGTNVISHETMKEVMNEMDKMKKE